MALTQGPQDNWYIFKRLIQVGAIHKVYDTAGRPPFPIVIENPQFKDVMANMGLPEYVPLLVSGPLGAAFSYYLTSDLRHTPVFRL
jgi:hypothetical protein